MGKGSNRRPTLIGCEENKLRWQLAYGEITMEEFTRRMQEIKKNGTHIRRY